MAFTPTGGSSGGVADASLDAYLEMFPTRATQAGNHAFDRQLEDFSAEKLERWTSFNRAERDRLAKVLNALIYRSTIVSMPKRCSPRWSASCMSKRCCGGRNVIRFTGRR